MVALAAVERGVLPQHHARLAVGEPRADRGAGRVVDEMASGDEEVAEYVAALEQAQDTSELPEASGDAIAKEFERYLRRRGGETSGPA